MSTDAEPTPSSKSESRTKLREQLVGRYVEILSRDAFWARCEITGLSGNHLTVEYIKPVLHDGALRRVPITDRIPFASLRRLRLYRK